MQSNIVDLDSFRLKKGIVETTVSEDSLGLNKFKKVFLGKDKFKLSESIAEIVIASFNNDTLLKEVLSYLMSITQDNIYLYKKAMIAMSSIAELKKILKDDVRTKENNVYVATIHKALESLVGDIKVLLIGTKLYMYSSEVSIDTLQRDLFKLPNFPLKVNSLTKVKGEDGTFLLIADLTTKEI